MLPQLSIKLPKLVTPRSLEHYKKVAKKLERLANGAGTSSRKFQERVERFRRLSEKGDPVDNFVKSAADMRAVIHLWNTDSRFLKQTPFTERMLSCFRQVAPFATRLCLLGMVALYFDKYDQLGEGLYRLRGYLNDQFSSDRKKPLPRRLATFANSATELLGQQAPQVAIEPCVKAGLSLPDRFEEIGITQGDTNRFQNLCTGLLFIGQLKELTPGQESQIFKELTRAQVYELPYEEGMLGHKALEIMIDKCKERGNLPDNWRDVILGIASDPRVPSGNPDYQTWWVKLGVTRTEWVRQRLSGFDLKVFLDVLRDYADNSGKEDIRRMFPARQQFLEGLFKQELVKQSRLFLGESAISYLRRRYHGKTLPHYAKQSDAQTAIMYLDLGKCHIVEGTHSFPLIMVQNVPPSMDLLAYGKHYYKRPELNQDLLREYEKMRGRKGYNLTSDRIPHLHNLTWQHKAIVALRKYGIYIRPASVLTRQDYSNFTRNRKYSL